MFSLFSRRVLAQRSNSVLSRSLSFTIHQTNTKDGTMEESNLIAIIGRGNMAKTVIGGLLNDGVTPDKIILSSPSINHLPSIDFTFNKTTHTFKVAKSNKEAIIKSDSIILVVKPFNAEEVLTDIAPVLDEKPLISVMAGISINTIQSLLNAPNANIIRLMPNTPASIGKGTGASYVKPTTFLSNAQLNQVNTITLAFGCPITLHNETLLNAVTATSGSGSAYVYLLIECLLDVYEKRGINSLLAMDKIRADFEGELQPSPSNNALIIRQFKNNMKQCAIDMGLTQKDAGILVEQTFSGAMALVNQTLGNKTDVSPKDSVAQLIINVTSKGGTTFAALDCFRKQGLLDIITEMMAPDSTKERYRALQNRLDITITKSMSAAYERAEEMAETAEQKANPIITLPIKN